MRIFFAFEIPENIKIKISSIISSQNIKNVRWIDKNNFHLTLTFIGNVKKKDLPDILNFAQNNLSDISQFSLNNPKLEIIPSHSPKIIWISFSQKNDEINKKKILFENYLTSLGYTFNKRPFKFHLTLSRIKKEIDLSEFKILTGDIFNFCPFKIERLTCFESILSSKGAKYRVVKSFKLRNRSYNE